MIHLIRHAHAGKRARWKGDDRQRPLTGKGWHQSKRLASRLVANGDVTMILTSPHTRCVETVMPLSILLGIDVTTHRALREGRNPKEALALIRELPPGAVLCSHGDVVSGVIKLLAGNGTDLKGVKGRPVWQKASTWELTRSKKGRVKEARYVPPP